MLANSCIPIIRILLLDYYYIISLYYQRRKGTIQDQNPKNIPKIISYENYSHFWNIFAKKHTCSTSYIQKKTPNPNIVFKISIYNTNTLKILKYISKKYCFRNFRKSYEKTENLESFKSLFCYIYHLHNSYFVKNICVETLYFLYIFIYIYIYIHVHVQVSYSYTIWGNLC